MATEKSFRICVFGSSARTTPQYILDASYKLGELLATKNQVCVNGGGMFGVMGSLNQGARAKDGKIIGVIHENFLLDVKVDHLIKDLVVTKGNHLDDRKLQLYDNSDAFIVMPGGLGTFDEMFDCLCCKNLCFKNLNNKPIVVVNLNGYFDGAREQLHRAEREHLLYSKVDDVVRFVSTVEAALDYCLDILNHPDHLPKLIPRCEVEKVMNNAKSACECDAIGEDSLSESILARLGWYGHSPAVIASVAAAGVMVGSVCTFLALRKR